jgi:hypothetical protein
MADRRAAQTRCPCMKRCSRRFPKSNPRLVEMTGYAEVIQETRLADHPTTQRESNARRRIGRMLAMITNPFSIRA